jgi:hypothetical protein
MSEHKRSLLNRFEKEDLIDRIIALEGRLHKKKQFAKKVKANLTASRKYNGQLRKKVLYLQSRIVDYFPKRASLP